MLTNSICSKGGKTIFAVDDSRQNRKHFRKKEKEFLDNISPSGFPNMNGEIPTQGDEAYFGLFMWEKG